MNAESIRLFKEPHQSFIYSFGSNFFVPWHVHHGYELSLITKGKGIRIVGDSVSRFKDNDLVLIGAHTPHESRFDPEYYDGSDGLNGEGIIVQFDYDFLGADFFKAPENSQLERFIKESRRGFVFFGETRKKINSILRKMKNMGDSERIYSLLSIFRIFSTTEEVRTISSVAFDAPFWTDESGPLQRAMQYILQNFQKPISLKDLLQVTGLSHTSFYAKFKKTYLMSFKDYLLSIRIGYACKLLAEGSSTISSIAYQSGFENISNFNRQFKKMKGVTPSEYQEKVSKRRSLIG